MTNKKNTPEEYDDGSSIEKTIEELDKDDPLYGSKREKLVEKMQKLKDKLEKQHKQIAEQRKKLSKMLGSLRKQAENNPQNESLQNLIAETEYDKAFLTRATAEIVSLKGNWYNEMGKLSGSKNFNVHLDLKIITNTELKPLPSSELNRKKEKTQEILKTQTPHNTSRGHHKSAALIARRIFNLRQSTSERTLSAPPKERERTKYRTGNIQKQFVRS